MPRKIQVWRTVADEERRVRVRKWGWSVLAPNPLIPNDDLHAHHHFKHCSLPSVHGHAHDLRIVDAEIVPASTKTFALPMRPRATERSHNFA